MVLPHAHHAQRKVEVEEMREGGREGRSVMKYRRGEGMESGSIKNVGMNKDLRMGVEDSETSKEKERKEV